MVTATEVYPKQRLFYLKIVAIESEPMEVGMKHSQKQEEDGGSCKCLTPPPPQTHGARWGTSSSASPSK
jgi:hypothetical protein